MSLCKGCERAERENAERLAAGDNRYRAHSCYRIAGWEGECSCAACNPPGSFNMVGTAEVTSEIQFDLAGLIREYRQEYLEAKLQGHAAWERPMVFIWEYLEAEVAGGLVFYGDHLDALHDNFDFNERGHWTEARFLALCAVCPEAHPDWKPEGEPVSSKPELPGQLSIEDAG